MSEKSKQNPNPKMRVKFFTLGCKVNQYESQALMEEFIARGHKAVKDKADLCVINTCTVTARADAKSRAAVRKVKRQNPQAKIAVCGCAVQIDSDFIRGLNVDYVIPQDSKAALVDIILNNQAEHNDIWELKISRFYNHRAFVKIQDGCDNFCSFCKIPYLRGRPRSRPLRQILEEIARLSQNYKEIVLCGMNLGLYGRDLKPAVSLSGLIKKILAIPGLARLRLSSLEPRLIDDSLISLLPNEKLCPHLHLPFQSGDDSVLAAMNKKTKVSLYREIVDKVRKVSPDIAVSCDIMAGFPSETQKTFQNTLDFIRDIEPMRMHIFTFSPRQATPFASAVVRNRAEVNRQYRMLNVLSKEFSAKYRRNFLGRTLYMAAEERYGGFVCGYTENYIRMHIKDEVHLGSIVPVKIKKIENERTIGRINASQFVYC